MQRIWIGLAVALAASGLAAAWFGLEAVGDAIGRLGPGLVLMVPAFLPHLALLALAWHRLLPQMSLGRLLLAWWIGLSAGALTPAGYVGIELARIRVLIMGGLHPVAAMAAAVVDQTLQAFAIVAVSLVGAGLVLAADPASTVPRAAAAVAGGGALVILGFVLVQLSRGAGRLARRLERLGRGRLNFHAGAAALDAAFLALWRQPRRLGAGFALHAAARALMGLEIWVAAWAMGVPLDLIDALVLRVVVGLFRSAAIVVPAGLGVQEVGFGLLAPTFGLAEADALALSLAIRAREIVMGVPALLVWQRLELRRRRIKSRPDTAPAAPLNQP